MARIGVAPRVSRRRRSHPRASAIKAQLPDLEDERGRGLYLMRQMVDTMEVDPSADGRGLTFRITRKHASR
jgi:anti-sigma regulatory factor (Ser/Thr protein kinase)